MQRRLASVALCCVAGYLAAAVSLTAAAEAGKHDNKPDPACIAYDLRVWALIERHENDELYASVSLVDAALLLADAKSMCARGDVQSALTIYRSVLQDLTDEIRSRFQE